MHLVKILLTYVYIDIQLYATRKPYQSTFDIHATFQRYSSNVCIFWYNVHKSMWTFWAAYALLEFFWNFTFFLDYLCFEINQAIKGLTCCTFIWSMISPSFQMTLIEVSIGIQENDWINSIWCFTKIFEKENIFSFWK